MMGYRCQHFKITELVYPTFHAKWGERAWDWLNPKLLITLDELRARFGSLKINDWEFGGQFRESGLRAFDTKTGASDSLHKYGCAADIKSPTTSAEEMQREILAHPDRFPMLTAMEDAAVTRTWLHIDVRNHNDESQIRVVKP